jgi:peptide/nickel transport system permease protein
LSAIAAPPVPVERHQRVSLVWRALRLWRTRIGLLIAGALVAVAIFGPYFAPFGAQEFAGSPYQPAGGKLVFGADNLGQDVWSRFLDGGRSILVVSVLSTILGVGVGVLVGLSAALARRSLDDLLMRAVDLLLAFPSILLALVAVATVGPKSWLIVLTVAATTMPRTARVIRGAGVSVVERDFVTAARAIGDGHFRVLFFEVLPNVTGTLVVEVTLRLTYAIGLIAALAFLGVTTNPNGADWGTMVQENAGALILQPWGCLLPAIAIGLLTVGTGLVGDGLARASSGIDRGA